MQVNSKNDLDFSLLDMIGVGVISYGTLLLISIISLVGSDVISYSLMEIKFLNVFHRTKDPVL